jgi:hypothetical protein
MPLTHSSTIDDVADALELLASCSKGSPISIGTAKDFVTKIGGLEQQAIEAFAKLYKRSSSLGEKHPVKVTAEYIQVEGYIWESPYLLMTSFSGSSLFSELQGWSVDTSSKLFEIVSEKCLGEFFGESTQTRNFGHPSDVGRPSEFGEAVKWIASSMKVPLGSGYRPPRRKDGGVDIFVWKEFKDGFPGVPILLIQCTIQGNFQNKIGDVDTRLWASWLSSDIDPLVGLCVPQMVVKLEKWSEITTRGLLFDRNRLSSMGPAALEIDAISQGYVKELVKQFQEVYL